MVAVDKIKHEDLSTSESYFPLFSLLHPTLELETFY